MTAARDEHSPAAEPAGERIVIRDKRKVSPAGGGAATKDGANRPSQSGADMGEGKQQSEVEASGSAVSPAEVAADAPVQAADTAPAEVSDLPTDATEAVAEKSREESAPDLEIEAADDGSGPLGAELELLRAQLDEAQVDIKRVAAEYKNYRDRVKRDQSAVAEKAVADTLVALLPVLDDLDRAREHGDLTGPFGSVAEQLTAIVAKLGLTAFGAKGDPFDPKRHEAVAHLPSTDVTEPTCIDVLRRGYLLGERLLRPAMVAVAAPE